MAAATQILRVVVKQNLAVVVKKNLAVDVKLPAVAAVMFLAGCWATVAAIC